MPGFLYVMSNPSFRYIKVGRCGECPLNRRYTLSRASAVPTPFKLERAWKVDNAAAAEYRAKNILSMCWYSREFYDMPVEDAIRLLEGNIEMEVYDHDAHMASISGVDLGPIDLE